MSGKVVTIICLICFVVFLISVVAGAILYGISNSKAAETARTFLRSNERLKSDIGEVHKFNWLISGRIKNNRAELSIQTTGERTTVTSTVNMVYAYSNSGTGAYRVTGASYVNATGQIVELPISNNN